VERGIVDLAAPPLPRLALWIKEIFNFRELPQTDSVKRCEETLMHGNRDLLNSASSTSCNWRPFFMGSHHICLLALGIFLSVCFILPPVDAQDSSLDPTSPTTAPVDTTTDAPVDTTAAPPPGATTPAPLAPTGEATTSGSNIPADYDGPVGVTGIFNGNITTGCSYDPLTHSAKRTIDDIVVPGSIGKYPLKLTRYYNSRSRDAGRLGPGWQHEYSWLVTSAGNRIVTPSGAAYDYRCDWPVGVAEHWEPDNNARPNSSNNYTGTFRLADGGQVEFTNLSVSAIVDPYGQRTTISYGPNGISRVTEPGGRYLQFYYLTSDTVYGSTFWLLTYEGNQ
jgi:hypothetical protein